MESHINSRRVRDNTYGFIEFDDNIWKIIDTPQFQRLRYIKQLGTSYLVFPGAQHTRFEHSIGVAHLSNQIMDNLAHQHYYQYNQLNLENKEDFQKHRTMVQIAGLCHDLGHGPFSHMFDNELLPRLGENSWKHEKGSQILLEDILINNNIIKDFKCLETKDVKTIQQLIDGVEYNDNQSNLSEPRWIYEIISNKKNSIDIDKFDYMRRDSYNTGVSGFDYDFTTIMRDTRVIDNTLAYHQKHAFDIYNLYSSRYRLFKSVYQHRVNQSLELMICDALYEANNVYHFKESIYKPEKYVKFTDCIIQEILNSSDERLTKSQNILKNIHSRNLYKYVTEQLIDSEEPVNKEKLKRQIAEQCKIDENQIYIVTFKTSYCMKDKNPVDSVHFYTDKQIKFQLKKEQVSLTLPNSFQEQYIRIFYKTDPTISVNMDQLSEKINNALKLHINENNIKGAFGYEKKSNPQQKISMTSEQHALFGEDPRKILKREGTKSAQK